MLRTRSCVSIWPMNGVSQLSSDSLTAYVSSVVYSKSGVYLLYNGVRQGLYALC